MNSKKKNTTDQAKQSSHNIGRLIFQLQRLERHPRTFGGEINLTPSEIHAIDAIGIEGEILMSELARRLDVTKGAVTQVISRLESKKLVFRSPHYKDSRAVLISLTERGKVAFQAHEELHEQFYARIREELDPNEVAIFERCIKIFTDLLKEDKG
ncbi:MarR family transcriptional regulator [Cytobacillus sp. IB215316]|uniref:MarR family winged helix-turn-helix transcriptional regulator n=1 Tax=Cytobacillus sp. IB215316 TaxID=3097354 RepID=UPI002A12E393|nr:MarR family transcriptional regulator [Cytobacillus sp. IB215316]MDX8360127.1 MarR family transcriptional regulator [Cytobacillus sp. IB215316]